MFFTNKWKFRISYYMMFSEQLGASNVAIWVWYVPMYMYAERTHNAAYTHLCDFH